MLTPHFLAVLAFIDVLQCSVYFQCAIIVILHFSISLVPMQRMQYRVALKPFDLCYIFIAHASLKVNG